jgi:hypothetical protein
MWFGIGTFSICFWMIIFIIHMYKRSRSVDFLLETVQEFAENFFIENPKVSQDYYNDLLYSKSYMMKRFWVQDLNEFIIDQEKIQELIHYNAKRAGRLAEEDIEFDTDLHCPWCNNEDQKTFYWIDFEENALEPLGSIECDKCGMTTPVSTVEECIEMIPLNEKSDG